MLQYIRLQQFSLHSHSIVLLYGLQLRDRGDELVAETDGVALGGEEDSVESVGQKEVRHPAAFQVESVRDYAEMDVGRERGGIFLEPSETFSGGQKQDRTVPGLQFRLRGDDVVD